MGWLTLVLPWCFAIGVLVDSCRPGDVPSAASGPVVFAKAGNFEGLKITPPGSKQAVHAFLGIPYAEPPTGTQRFRKPTPIRVIPGIFKATQKPPSCNQLDSDLRLPWADPSSLMKEDCLYLNVWAPESRATEGSSKPVMVWIHGGGYTVGSSAKDLYDGQVLSSHGDVVVVTLNYRLNSFGFLNTRTEDTPGNVALYDQLLALQWVQNNIEHFGGDSKRVTLFGESVGAMSTGFLALSPLSRGLFHRMIVQSGSSYSPLTQNPSYNIDTGTKLAVLVGCANETSTLSSQPKEVTDCLRCTPATDLVKSYYEQDNSHQVKMKLNFDVNFWDAILPLHPVDTFRLKNYTAIDVFAGVNQVEGSSLFVFFFPEVYQQYVDGKLTMTRTLAVDLLTGLFKGFHLEHPEKPVQFYLKNVDDDQQSLVKAIFAAIGDYVITCPTVYLAEKYAERGVQLHFYRFDHTPSTLPWPKWFGAAHNEEIQFVFGMPIRYPGRYQEGEGQLSEYMMRIWTNFAKSENLTLKSGLPWPDFSRSKPEYATFQTDEQVTGSGERSDQCEFWRPYFDAQ